MKATGEERRLLVEIFQRFRLKLSLSAESECVLRVLCVLLHVTVEAGFLVGGEVTVGALVLLTAQNILVVVPSVTLQEAARFKLLPTQDAGIDCEGLAVRADDDCYREERYESTQCVCVLSTVCSVCLCVNSKYSLHCVCSITCLHLPMLGPSVCFAMLLFECVRHLRLINVQNCTRRSISVLTALRLIYTHRHTH